MIDGFCYRQGTRAASYFSATMAAFQQLNVKGSSDIPLFSDDNHPDA
jgi:hypothetical protein